MTLMMDDDAERAAIDAERAAKRNEADTVELARRLREGGAGVPDPSEERGDVLEGLVDRAIVDVGAAFLPSVLDALADMHDNEPPVFAVLLARLKKETDVSITDLRQAVATVARRLKRDRTAAQQKREMDARQEAARQKFETEMALVPEEFHSHFYEDEDRKYSMRPGRIHVRDADGRQLCARYSARIVAEIVLRNGVRESRFYDLELIVDGAMRKARVAAEEFHAMRWPQLIGADVITEAGTKARESTRAAIQSASGSPPVKMEYALTGWQQIGGESVYLHAGGTLGAECGVTVNLESRLGKLAWLALPKPLQGEDLAAGVDQCLQLMFADRAITAPLCVAPWRAVLGENRNVLFVYGTQKIGKTTAILWAQNHFSTRYTTTDVPMSWTSTPFGIRAALAMAGDMVLLVDDYRPTQDPKHAATFNEIVRNVTDGTSRTKGTIDSTTQQDPAPRALPIVSGETRPRTDSVASRLVLIPMFERLSITSEQVEEFNRWAREGRFSGTMAAYITWLAPRLAEVRRGYRSATEQLTQRLVKITKEGRSAAAIAGLFAGAFPFLRFAVEIKAIAEEQGKQVQQQLIDVAYELAAGQINNQEQEDVVARFFSYLSSAIRSGSAHLTNSERRAPENCAHWGWQVMDSSQEDKIIEKNDGGVIEIEAKFRPAGKWVGVVGRKGLLYLDRNAAYRVVKDLCKQADEPFAVDVEGLMLQLEQRGVLQKTASTGSIVRLSVAESPDAAQKRQRSGFICVSQDQLCGLPLYEPTGRTCRQDGENNTETDDGK